MLPLDLLHTFDEHELELLIGRMTEIDMDHWTQFTDHLGYERTDRVIEWFWECPLLVACGVKSAPDPIHVITMESKSERMGHGSTLVTRLRSAQIQRKL